METTQMALLNKIREYQFVCVELNLYLNTHPEDEAARTDYLCYGRRLTALIDQYDELYEPLMNFGHSPTEAGSWAMSKWPWE